MQTISWNIDAVGRAQDVLASGGVCVLPTDTIYGVVCDARNKAAVERLYELKGRTPEKPVIILIGRREQIHEFGVVLSRAQVAALDTLWPGAVSVIVPCPDTEDHFTYLHRGTRSLAFRLPESGGNEALRELASNTPIAAPSANPEGEPPAETIEAAREYFGDGVDLYADAGPQAGSPSALVSLSFDGTQEVLRGALPS